MQNKLTTIKTSAAIMLLALYSCSSRQKNDDAGVQKEDPYKVFLVQKSYTDTSWGYIIEHNDHVLIKQFSIPVLQGNLPFKNKQQAALVGKLVTNRLNHAQRPSVTKKELDSLGIISSIYVKQ